jgi:hypothetical protein
MVSPSRTLAAPADPNEIAMYSLPSRPSVSIDATESCLMMSCVELSRSMTTVTFSPWPVRQLDTMHGSAVNAAHPNVGAHIQAHHIVELRL